MAGGACVGRAESVAGSGALLGQGLLPALARPALPVLLCCRPLTSPPE